MLESSKYVLIRDISWVHAPQRLLTYENCWSSNEMLEFLGNMCSSSHYQWVARPRHKLLSISSLTDENWWSSKRRCSNFFGDMCSSSHYQWVARPRHELLNGWKLLKLKTEMLEFLRKCVLNISSLTEENRWSSKRRCSNFFGIVSVRTYHSSLTDENCWSSKRRCSNFLRQ
jgi:hypothetical protein